MSAPATEPKKDEHAKDPKKDEHHKDKEHKKEEVKSTIPPKTIAVVGGTGHVGHSVAMHLFKYQHNHHTAHKIHIGVRDPKSAKSVELAKHPGITVGAADMSKADNLAEFLKATDVALLVTPGAEKRAELVASAAEAAKKAGVKHIVALSLTSVEKDGLFGKQFQALEKAIKGLGVNYTIVRLPFFADNLMGNKDSIVNKASIFAPIKGSSKFDSISVDDIGHFFACLMAGPDLEKYQNKTLNCTGPDTVSYDEIAKWFGESLKKDAAAIKFVSTKPEDHLKAVLGAGWPEWQAKGLLELYSYIDAGEASMQLVTDDFKNVVGHKPHSISTWIGHQGHNFIPHPEEHKKDHHDKEKEKEKDKK